MKSFENKYATMEARETDLLYITYKPGVLDEDGARQVVADRVEFMGGISHDVVILDSEVTKITKAARDFFSSAEGTRDIKSCAVIVKSSFSRVLVNFILKVSPPSISVRLFNEIDDGLAWLKKQG